MKISRLPRLEICSQSRSWQKSSQIIPLRSQLEATVAELSWDYRLDEVSNYYSGAIIESFESRL